MSETEQTSATSGRGSASVEDVIDGVISYAKSETIGPLRGAGRWIAWGALGALLIGVGGALALLGLLRLLQAEWPSVAGTDVNNSRLSWLPYLIVFVVGATFVGLALTKINRSHLLGGRSKEGSK